MRDKIIKVIADCNSAYTPLTLDWTEDIADAILALEVEGKTFCDEHDTCMNPGFEGDCRECPLKVPVTIAEWIEVKS